MPLLIESSDSVDNSTEIFLVLKTSNRFVDDIRCVRSYADAKNIFNDWANLYYLNVDEVCIMLYRQFIDINENIYVEYAYDLERAHDESDGEYQAWKDNPFHAVYSRTQPGTHLFKEINTFTPLNLDKIFVQFTIT